MGIHRSIWGAGGSGEVPINDGGAAEDEVWSAEKISAELAGLDKYTKAEVDAALEGKSGSTHDHDSDYAASSHLHTEAAITDLDKYTQAEVDALLAGAATPATDFGKQITYLKCMEMDDALKARVTLDGVLFEGGSPAPLSKIAHFDGTLVDGQPIDVLNGNNPHLYYYMSNTDGKYGDGFNFYSNEDTNFDLRYLTNNGLWRPDMDGGAAVAFWVKRSYRTYTRGYLMQGLIDDPYEQFYLCMEKNDGIRVMSSHGTSSNWIVIGPDLTEGVWYHLALSFSATRIELYIDGSWVGGCDYNPSLVPDLNYNRFRFGSGYNGGQNFGGLIDEIVFLDQPIDADDATALMAQSSMYPATGFATALRAAINAGEGYTASILVEDPETVRVIGISEGAYTVAIENLESYRILARNFEDVETALDDKSDDSHTHTESAISDLDKYTQAEVDAALAGKADSVHNHDSSYAAASHAHAETDISDLDKYTQAEVDALLAGMAAAGHDHFTAPPASAADTGTKGQWSYNAGYLYKCVDTDTWVRLAVVTSW